jgi:UDP-2,4-diacetamido-2,4,6-trideoxy-beta-L-altropyranose hydrolase
VIPLLGNERIVFRCDGDQQIGAGHVARCIPLAKAFAQVGWKVSFVGAYEGLAEWLLARAGIAVRVPDLEAPCGVTAKDCEAAVLDSYVIAPSSICELADTLPVVTLAEANNCPSCGVLLDYHLDRSEPSNVRLLAGPSYAPLDPAFAGAGRAADEIRGVLVTMGGSLPARGLLTRIAQMASSIFPDADIILAGGHQSETIEMDESRVIHLPAPSALVDIVSDVDLAITAAGWTAYELACAGIPQVAIAIVANQHRVVKGLNNGRMALCLDLTSGDSLTDLPVALKQLADPELRRQLAVRGRKTFDGQGARRAARALTKRYRAMRVCERSS